MQHDPALLEDSGEIPRSELEQIYQSEIAPAFLEPISPASDKRAILVGGQPGSGKSSVTPSLVDPDRDDFVAIDADELRTFVPGYTERARSMDEASDAANWSHKATQFFTSRLLEDATSKGTNVLYDSTLADAEKAISTVQELSEQGYSVDIAYVSTNPSISERSVFQRYFYDKRSIGHEEDLGDIYPRYVPQHVRTDAGSGLLGAVDAIDKYSSSVSNVELSLWERSSAKGDPAQKLEFQPGQAATVMEQSHERQLSNQQQLEAHFQEWDDMAIMIMSPDSKATPAELRETALAYENQVEKHHWQDRSNFPKEVAGLLAFESRLEDTSKKEPETYTRAFREVSQDRLKEDLESRIQQRDAATGREDKGRENDIDEPSR